MTGPQLSTHKRWREWFSAPARSTTSWSENARTEAWTMPSRSCASSRYGARPSARGPNCAVGSEFKSWIHPLMQVDCGSPDASLCLGSSLHSPLIWWRLKSTSTSMPTWCGARRSTRTRVTTTTSSPASPTPPSTAAPSGELAGDSVLCF